MNKNLTLKYFLFLLVISTSILCKAQVNLDFTTINEYAFSTKEALNLIVTNGNTKAINVYFNGKIKDANGNPVVEFKTHEAVLNAGTNVFTPMNLSISEMQYANNDIAEIESSSGTYPSGNYTICIWATCVTPDCNGLGQNAISMEEPKCVPVHIENPTPLILATPLDDSEIEETRPLYTWIPPAPVAGSSNLNYTMILVEMLEGQSKADALTQNRPIIEVEGIGNPSLMHPSDLPALEKGKWYAWQVQAYVGRTPIAKSEQWKFKIKKELIKRELPTYVKLKTDDNNIYSVKESLNLTYTEEYIPQQLDFTVYTLEGAKLFSNSTDYKTLRGENTYTITRSELNAELNKVYELHVKNSNGELYTLRFTFN